MPLFILDALEAIRNFFTSGGPVLYLIIIWAFIMWAVLLERVWYFLLAYRADIKQVTQIWESRAERSSWYASVIRDQLISEICIKINQNLTLIKTCIIICPLLGLLGTVTGMIEVFTVLSITGGSDVRSMAGGVSRATLPTMAGMMVALSGVFANIYITQRAKQERALITEHFPLEN